MVRTFHDLHESSCLQRLLGKLGLRRNIPDSLRSHVLLVILVQEGLSPVWGKKCKKQNKKINDTCRKAQDREHRAASLEYPSFSFIPAAATCLLKLATLPS